MDADGHEEEEGESTHSSAQGEDGEDADRTASDNPACENGGWDVDEVLHLDVFVELLVPDLIEFYPKFYRSYIESITKVRIAQMAWINKIIKKMLIWIQTDKESPVF